MACKVVKKTLTDGMEMYVDEGYYGKLRSGLLQNICSLVRDASKTHDCKQNPQEQENSRHVCKSAIAISGTLLKRDQLTPSAF